MISDIGMRETRLLSVRLICLSDLVRYSTDVTVSFSGTCSKIFLPNDRASFGKFFRIILSVILRIFNDVLSVIYNFVSNIVCHLTFP